MTTIKLKNGSGAPTAGDLVQGEPALDLTNKRLYTEDSGGTVIEVGTNPGEDVTFADNRKAVFGAGSDLQIYHDGSNSYINDTGTGNLFVRASDNFYVQNSAGTETKAAFTTDGAVKLYYNGGTKFQTVSGGVDVTGVITTDGMTTSADINFGDNDKAVFGAGNDLSVYHDGSNSYIKEEGTGNLEIGTNGGNITLKNLANSETLALFNINSGVNLYYDNAVKLETTSTGIDVTGVVTADGLTVQTAQGNIEIANSSAIIDMQRAGTNYILASNASGNLRLGSGNNFNRLDIANNGDISFYEDTGTTAKLFWDASAERLGLGTSSPSAPLHVIGGGTGSVLIDGTDSIRPSTDSSLITISGGNATNSGANYSIFGGSHASLANVHRWRTDGTERMRIDSNGRVGIGTTPVRVLDIATTTGGTIIHLTDDATGHTATDGVDLQQEGTLFQILNREAGDIRFGTDNTERMRIDSSGNVGIGVTSVSNPLHVYHATNNNLARFQSGDATAHIQFRDNSTTYIPSLGAVGDDLTFAVGNGAPERMRIDASGQVGIGTDSPVARLTSLNTGSLTTDSNDGDHTGFGLFLGNDSISTNTVNTAIGFGNTTSGRKYAAIGMQTYGDTDQNGLNFYVQETAGGSSAQLSEAMRLTYQGNLLVGKTSADDFSSAGAQIEAGGQFTNSVASAPSLRLNRGGNDGDIIELNKAGTPVGSIFNSGTTMGVGSLDTGVLLANNIDAILPWNASTNAERGSAIDLGRATTGQFKDLYLSGAWKSVGDLTLDTAAASSNIILKQNGTERWRINTNGVLSINNTVLENIGGTPSDLNSTEMGSGYLNLNRDDTASAVQIQFGKNGSVAGSIVTTTNTTYNTTSDRRAKENIADADDAGAIVDAIQVRKFDWKGDGTHQRYGMIAQELLESAPEVVHQPENTEQMMGVDYSKLVPMMLKEIQSLRARVAQLEGEN